VIQPSEIQRLILAALPGATVSVRDLTGGGDHYEIDIVSAAFEGLPTLQRHRLVHAPLRDVLGAALHAVALRTRTPNET
jgi:stress-induced morphogen